MRNKTLCIECRKPKSATAFNYAGFDSSMSRLHVYQGRIQAPILPGIKDMDFLCVDCANKLTVRCIQHGDISAEFSMGVPPLCQFCKTEYQEKNRNQAIQRYWKEHHPSIAPHLSYKKLFLLGALAATVMKSDGEITENEVEAALRIFSKKKNFADRTDFKIFSTGVQSVNNKQLKFRQLLELCYQIKGKKQHLNIIKYLFRISASDGQLDKAEYQVIRQVAELFGIKTPSFEDLANRLNVETGHAARDRKIEMVGNVVKAVGTGVAVAGSLLLSLLSEMVESTTSSQNGRSSARPDPLDNRTSARKTEKPSCSATRATQVNASKKKEQSIIYGTVGNSYKNCVTCEFWDGLREPQKYTGAVRFPSKNNKGTCQNKATHHRKTSPTSTCSKWNKWSRIS
ncbi:TerB family tellurite resistance protein [Alteromonas sp. MMG017]|uniref:TerB family tellurite resistance protein n=1 Tax=Alteromonas sp. MMG017 TaxID=2822692 RepID=UPI001B39F596|nr:TerB family tellurite resistance protein [Alteromonas sp. MMG017]MBQ4830607.1 TerB family tellurite resistance protein [Alteromonas sp. MMG017]